MPYLMVSSRTHLKNVFWSNIFVGASLQILDIQQYASGLKLGPAAILNQNPIFEMGSKQIMSDKILTTAANLSESDFEKSRWPQG